MGLRERSLFGGTMSTDLEKQFFDAFGIEPKEIITCIIEEDWLNDYHLKTWYPISDWMKNNAPCKGEKECSNKCNCYQVKNKYPQITDRQYLELICLYNRYDNLFISSASKIENLKIHIFNSLISAFERENTNELKHQVQTIFEVER